MPALNRIQLIGHLDKDPESKVTSTEKKVTHLRLAITNRWKDREGTMREYTEWVDVEAWGRLGKVCYENLRQGNLIYLEGRLRSDNYDDQGEMKFYTKVVALSMQMLDHKPSDEPLMGMEE